MLGSFQSLPVLSCISDIWKENIYDQKPTAKSERRKELPEVTWGQGACVRLKAEGPELCAPGSKLSPWGIGLELRSHCTRRLGWTIV